RRAGHLAVTGDEEPAAPELDADARSGGVPRPVRLLDVLRDLDRSGPRHAVVGRFRHPDGARPPALAVDNLRLGIDAEVVRQQQPDGAGGALDDRTGVAAGVRPVVPDDCRLFPGLAAVEAAPQ